MAISIRQRLSTSLIDPYVPMPNAERRQNARTLAGIVLALFPLMLAMIAMTALLMPDDLNALGQSLPYGALLLASSVAIYFMARLGRERLAAASLVGIVNVIILILAAPNGFTNAGSIFSYFLITVLLTCAFVSNLIGFFTLLAITIVAKLYTDLVVAPIADPGMYNTTIIRVLIIGMLMIGVMVHIKNLNMINRKQLHYNEMILRLIKENVSDMVTITDRAFNVDFQSDSVHQLASSEETERGAAFWQTGIAPDDQPDVAKAVDTALHTRTSSRAEYRHKAEDGTIHWYETTFNLVRDMDGFERLITISRNIDQRKAAELALVHERVQLRTLVDTLPDLIYIKDVNSRYILLNSAYLEFNEISEEREIIGKTAYDLYSPEMAEALTDLDREALATGKTSIDYNFCYEHRGKTQNFLITKTPIVDDTGKIIGLVGCSRDITQQITYESEQRERERLQMALDKERELNELKNLFMVTVSHEFRTPLATILSSSELLLSYAMRMTEERRVECLRTIAGEVKRLNIMLDDIRTVMHMQRREAQLNIEAIQLPDFVQDVFSKLENTAEHRCKIDITPELALIHGDRLLLRHIAHNLLHNAVSYSPSDAPVTVQGRQLSENEFIIEISDAGSGIPENELARVFAPFFRGSASMQTTGTGLGLTIVQHCIDLYGGTIHIKSEPEKGTRVTVTLPLYPATEMPAIDFADAQSGAE